MEIALMDEKLCVYQQIINSEKNKLLKKYSELKEKTKTNNYLEQVARNYQLYNEKIKKEKLEQKKAFEKLLCYFQTISKSLKKTDIALNEAVYKEKEIEDMILSLDGEIKQIIS